MSTIQFIGTTPNDLIKKISAEVIPQLKAELSHQFQPKVPNEYLTRAEVCELLKIEQSTLWRWKKQGFFPFYGIGNRVYCKRSEIEQFMENNKLN